MEECRYCSEVEDIDISRDIFFEHINAVFNDSVEVNLIDVTVWITDEAKMELFIDPAVETGCIVKKTVDINFCPFCGRRLRNDG